MTHAELEAHLDAYLDGELNAAGASELDAHLAHCPECASLRDERLRLRAALIAQIPVFKAPEHLRERIRAASGGSRAGGIGHGRRFGAGDWWRPLALAASLVIVALGSWRLALQHAASETLTNELLASHIRSLMPGHLTDVLSSNQHTVKPWFNGRLDFSPPVYDFADQGYPLLGGRLDYVDARSVAGIVYGRRQHLINVFVWPDTAGPAAGPSIGTRNGYHLLNWSSAGYSYWVVSDLGLPELEAFTAMFRHADSAAVAP